ncbi:MAG: hypothetical protein IKF91_04540 [Bacilli bacterium]|nr:hypothetical protein [Bacilli bacterium]
MKKIVRVLLSVLGVIYLGVILFATVCLLCYNQYKVTEIGDKSFILIDDKSDKYTDGDLVIFTKNANNEIQNGDEIFFYEVSQGKASVNTGVVTKAEVINENETTFTINGNHKISSESVIGKTLTASVYPKVGKILYIIESRFGFLLFVILPALLFFFYEIYRLVMEIKTPVTDDSNLESNTNNEEKLSTNKDFKEEKIEFPSLDNNPEPVNFNKTSDDSFIRDEEVNAPKVEDSFNVNLDKNESVKDEISSEHNDFNEVPEAETKEDSDDVESLF